MAGMVLVCCGDVHSKRPPTQCQVLIQYEHMAGAWVCRLHYALLDLQLTALCDATAMAGSQVLLVSNLLWLRFASSFEIAHGSCRHTWQMHT